MLGASNKASGPAGRSPEGRGGEGRVSALLPLLCDVRHRLRRGASHLPARRSRQSVHIISLQTLSVPYAKAGNIMTEVKRTVLAAVEDMFFLAKIEAAAKAAGVDLVEARSAEKVNEHLDALSPDLIILDVNTSAWDLLEVIRRIRGDPKFSSTPVVAFLSHLQVELARAARAAGC